jgi:hypothetical protein
MLKGIDYGFRPVNHVPAPSETEDGKMDHRWLQIRRPVIMTGGELTLRTLDLEFNPISKFYIAPLQMKANNGLLSSTISGGNR